MRRHRLRFLWAVACALLSSHAAAQVVINEVLYDPEGPDTGLEFVELRNCGRLGVSMTGWVLETGNGAHPDDWTVEWIGGDLDYIEPGQMFVIGEADVLPPPDYVTPLDLQNGPDGVRLTDGVGPVDVVGWGEPLFQEYYEGQPAADAQSGLSLARSPDCFDHGNNALDLVAGPPTPGAANTLSHDLRLEVRHPGRALFGHGEPVELQCVVRNVGSLPTGGQLLLVELLPDGSGTPACSSLMTNDLAPRDSLDVSLRWTDPVDGYHRASVALTFEPDSEPSNNTARTSFAVGGVGGLVAVNEVMHSPDDGGTEWVELVNISGDDIELAGWALGDDVDAGRIDLDSRFATVSRRRSVPARSEGRGADGGACVVSRGGDRRLGGSLGRRHRDAPGRVRHSDGRLHLREGLGRCEGRVARARPARHALAERRELGRLGGPRGEHARQDEQHPPGRRARGRQADGLAQSVHPERRRQRRPRSVPGGAARGSGDGDG